MLVSPSMPAKNKKTPKRYTAKQLAELAHSLRSVADRVDAIVLSMQNENVEALDVTNWRSGEIAIRHWQSFSRSANSAVDTAILNRAFDEYKE